MRFVCAHSADLESVFRLDTCTRICRRVATLLLVVPGLAAAQNLSITEYHLGISRIEPATITAGPDGAMWFTEQPSTAADASAGGLIGRISSSGVITHFPLQRQLTPVGITAGPDGALWFTTVSGGSFFNSVWRITTAGSMTEYPLPHPFLPSGITAGSDGALWFGEVPQFGNQVGTIGRITTDGVITEYPLSATFPLVTAIIVGPDGALWFTNGTISIARITAIGRITTSGVITEYPLPPDLGEVGTQGIITGPDGALWFTTLDQKIGHITPAGAIYEVALPNNVYPFLGPAGFAYGVTASWQGITLGSDGALWFTSYSSVGRISANGLVTLYPIPSQWACGITAGADGALWYTGCSSNVIGRIALPPTSLTLGIVPDSSGGNNQTGNVLQTLPRPLVVRVADQSGNPANGVPMSFQITQEPAGILTHATLTSSSMTTGSDGTASTTLTLGGGPGQYQVTASCQTCAPSTVVFTERTPMTVTLLDPIPLPPSGTTLLLGNSINPDPHVLATGGRTVQGIAADGVAQIVLRIAAGFEGEQLDVTFVNATGTSAQNGSLFDPLAPSARQSHLSVHAVVDPDVGPVAFAVYVAPTDFASSVNDGRTDRQVSVRVQSHDVPAIAADSKIRILRPKVLFIHGLWGSKSDWTPMFPLFPQLSFYLDAYSDQLDYNIPAPVNSGNPFTVNLARSKANNLGLLYNAKVTVLPRVPSFIDDYREGNNSLSIPIAAIQADIVAHSMGGDIIRTLPYVDGYFRPTNLDAGAVHKLLTIDTPHLGSPLATQLLDSANDCVRGLFNANGLLALQSVTIGTTVYAGAVGDLRGPGPSGGALSPALQTLQTPPTNAPSGWSGIPTAYVASTMDIAQSNGAGTGLIGSAIQASCSPVGDPLATSLNPVGWFVLMGQSDGIVPLESQLNHPGSVGNRPTDLPCAIHSTSTASLGFKPPSVFENPAIAAQVLRLLNSAVAGTFLPLP